MRNVMFLVTVLTTSVAAAAPCRPVAGSDTVLKPGARIVVGEMHGTNETPRVVGDLACAAGASGPLRVGLEIFADEQSRLDAYLRSGGTDADRKALLAGPFWTRDVQDGRSSTGMLALVESLRALVAAGRDVRIVAFDLPSTAKKYDTRDHDMAERLEAAFAREPKATFLVLVGNLHARKAPYPQFLQRFMAQYLVDDKQPIVTLNAALALGSMWACFGKECGPQPVGVAGATAPVAVTLKPSKDGAYDGTLGVGAPSWAAPAAKPITEPQKRLAALLDDKLGAYRARAHHDWTGFAKAELVLAQKDVPHAADYLYDAACGYALAGDATSAFTQLGAALDHGFADRASLENDDDLASLHGDARWKTIVARLSAPKK